MFSFVPVATARDGKRDVEDGPSLGKICGADAPFMCGGDRTGDGETHPVSAFPA